MLWKEVVAKYGEETADKMKKSQYLQGITLVIKRAFCEVKCPVCGRITLRCLDPYSNYITIFCPTCGCSRKFMVTDIIKSENDIPERDIDLAYRDVKKQYIHPEEWD